MDYYFWQRFIARLVQAGYGDFETAADADIETAAVFLFVQNDTQTFVKDFLSGKYSQN